MSSNYLENTSWDWAYLVECESCKWFNISRDYRFTEHSGTVHTRLKGNEHTVTPTEVIA